MLLVILLLLVAHILHMKSNQVSKLRVIQHQLTGGTGAQWQHECMNTVLWLLGCRKPQRTQAFDQEWLLHFPMILSPKEPHIIQFSDCLHAKICVKIYILVMNKNSNTIEYGDKTIFKYTVQFNLLFYKSVPHHISFFLFINLLKPLNFILTTQPTYIYLYLYKHMIMKIKSIYIPHKHMIMKKTYPICF